MFFFSISHNEKNRRIYCEHLDSLKKNQKLKSVVWMQDCAVLVVAFSDKNKHLFFDIDRCLRYN